MHPMASLQDSDTSLNAAALGDSAFLSNHAHDAFQLLRHALIGSDYIVERVRDLAGYTCPVLRAFARKKSPRLNAINAASNCLVSNSLPLVSERFRGRTFLVTEAFFITPGGISKIDLSSPSRIRRVTLRPSIFQRRRIIVQPHHTKLHFS